MRLPQLLSPLIQFALNQSSVDDRKPPCPWLGQVYPPPTGISSHAAWQKLIPELNDALDNIPSVIHNRSSHAIQIVSLHEETPLFEHYAKATTHRHGKDGTTPIDGDTVFRIASTSKAFTVYALLLKCGFKCFGDPITKYVPELDGQIASDATEDTMWDEITVGALAAQLSGLGRDYASGDVSGMEGVPGAVFGLPDLDPAEVIGCGVTPDQQPCSREESIKLMLRHPPAFPVWHTPSYSNMAYQLLSYVLQNITSQSYEEVMNESVFGPLKLDRTTVTLPDLAEGILEPGDPTFEWDQGDDAATGGIYSTANDLATWARHLLNHTQLTPSQTRRWLKPHSHTSLLQFSFGAPWEILRLPGVSAFHSVDLYTKAGSLGTYPTLPSYTTLFVLIPDLDIAVVVLSYTMQTDILASASPLAVSVFKQALEPLFDIAKAQALHKFGGTYIDERANVNSSMTISIDEDIGLIMSEFISNGTDLLAVLEALGFSTQAVRLFPATLSSYDKSTGRRKLAFRATLLSSGDPYATPFMADALKYGGIGIDLVVFDTRADGKASSVEVPAFRTTMRRVHKGVLRVQ